MKIVCKNCLTYRREEDGKRLFENDYSECCEICKEWVKVEIIIK